MVKNGKVKFLIAIIIFVLCLVLINNNEEERIRIRVISNSNDYLDLYQKEEVKDIVCSVIDVSDTEKEILGKLDDVKLLVDQYAMKHNLKINVEYGVTKFPPKELDGKIISGGNYQTLLITIGEGKGNNYWTLLYPEYFGYTFEDVYSGEVEIRSYVYDLIKDK